MNNDLEQFSEERLKKIISTHSHEEVVALARIALSAKQAKPIAYTDNLSLETLQGNGMACMWKEGNGAEWREQIPLYTTPQPAHTEQAKSAANEFLPENLDRALTIMGVALPESKEEFNFQAQRWTQRLIDRVIRYENEFQVQESHGEKHGCKWKPDEDSVYSTSCGNEWQFTEGGIEDNKIKFCPYCSGKIAAPKPESE